ncbi:hypothetical protein ACH9EU_05665 [Kocuria sp. M1R5S2]|uniref:hypothetical protein n=1 Tax=Kocuria rhizosphaerae TaxID=3376285 RepID=UPI0037B0EE56
MSRTKRWSLAFLGIMFAGCVTLGLMGQWSAWITAVAFASLIASVLNRDRRARGRQDGQP